MHQDPEHEDYDDDDYNYYPKNTPYSKYDFKFDYLAWEKWLADAIKQIVEEDNNTWSFKINTVPGFPTKKLPSTTTNASKNKYFMYLGNNQHDEAVWKKKYFVCDPIQLAWANHLESNAVHFLKQPNYYKGLFDILN